MHSDSCEKFKRLSDWIIQQGGSFQHINVPHTFQQGQVGMQAAEDIPAKTAIISIPFATIISVQKALNSQLKPFYNNHKNIFHPDMVSDSEFNVMGVFLFYEFLKGEKSFYFPYLQAMPKGGFIIVDWSEHEFQQLPPTIKSSLQYLQKQTQALVKDLVGIVRKEEIFKDLLHSQSDQELETQLMISFNLMMTRCFGYSVPSTSLVPLMDMLNHSDEENVTHYILNHQIERVGETKHKYRIKNRKLNLEMLGYQRPSLIVKLKDKEKYLQYNGKEIPKEDIDREVNNLNREKMLNGEKDIDWELNSDSEDNDSDQQEKEKRVELSKNLRKREVQARQKQLRIIRGLSLVAELEKKQDVKEGFDDSCSKKSDSGSRSVGSSDLSDIDFEFCQEDEGNVLIATTTRDIKKGEQLFTSYGRRSNQFLLNWYGFCLKSNKYDSVPVRLKTEYDSTTLFLELAEEVVYTDPLDPSEGELITHHFGLSKEFKLKQSRLSIQLMGYLRFYLRRYLGDLETYSIPNSYDTELKLLSFIESIIHVLTKKVLINHCSNIFTQRIKDSYQGILKAQLEMLKEAKSVVGKLKSKAETKSVIEEIPEHLFNGVGAYVFDLIHYGYQ